ncbi:AMP-binding enzyme family protein [Mycobacterium xenopi 3993]|nr:AMP-binding enzyme family protein [Mycobacterium xenopi 3993]
MFVRGEQVSGRYTGIGSVLDEDGWFPTKDIAMLDEDGYLFISGRSDDTIIRGGENIAPAELEDVLIEHPDVREVAVVGVDDPQWGQAIVAVVVPAEGADPDPEELRAYVRKSLRGSRTPDRVVFRDELPTNATGKLLRRELVEQLRAARPSSERSRDEIMIKNGTRLASQVCETQVIVVRSADSLDDLRCGGPDGADRRGAFRRAGSGVRRRQHHGQALCRRQRRRGTGDQGRCRDPDHR